MNRESLAEVLYNAGGRGALWEKQTDPKHRARYFRLADAVLQHLASQRQEQGEDLQAARAIGESFFEALKPLNLQAINVANPGQHVTDLIALVARLGEALAGLRHVMQFLEVQGRDRDLIATVGRAETVADHVLAELAPTTPTP